MSELATQDLKALLASPLLLEETKRRRDANHNQNLIPALRMVGLTFIVMAVFFHLKFIDHLDPRLVVSKLAILYAFYGGCSWLFLRAFYQSRSRLHWGDLFLVLDPALWMVAVYLTGADNSILFVILLARVADQTNTTFLRCLHFLNITASMYLVMVTVLHLGGRDIDWHLQAAKLAILYLVGFYISLTALAAQRLKNRTRQAVRLAKDTIDELAHQNTELAEARRAAEEVSRLKSGFLATMSHELRTPLNSVIGFSQLLEDPMAGDLNERQRRYLNNSLTGAHRLHALIGDILDLSKIEAGGLEVDLGPVDLKILLRQSVEAMSVQAAARKITVVENYQADLGMALADGFRLRQVTDNLLSNAVKYNVEAGEIQISTRLDGGALVISVQDTGPGIPADQQVRVFDAFVQLDEGYRRRSEGTGLGLALCKALCRLQNAELTLTSPVAAQRGSRFEVRLRPFRKGRES
jgi:signal transduction histidine kinase